MASSISRKILARRLLLLRSRPPSPPFSSSLLRPSPLPEPSIAPATAALPQLDLRSVPRALFSSSSSSSSSTSHPSTIDEAQAPAAIDYRAVLPEEEFHRLADDTLHDLQEKFEEYGDLIQVDGFDIDYGNHVLTLKLGDLGTYVINKQTPNRQIWLSSPVSGPSRFDWDGTNKAWVYRRTKASLLQLLEDELGSLCGTPITLS